VLNFVWKNCCNSKLIRESLDIDNERARIQTDTVQIEAKINDLEKMQFWQNKERKINIITHPERDGEATQKKLDIRGLRVDEAIPLIERFLNELSLSEFSTGVIIHGIGKGILRDSAREFLKDHPLVKTFSKGSPQEGGDAVTIVELK